MKAYCRIPGCLILSQILTLLLSSQVSLANNQIIAPATTPTQALSGSQSKMNSKFANNGIIPFKIEVADSEINDLQNRLQRTRLPDQLDNVSWEYGTNLSFMNDLVAYWMDEFDWKAQERLLNEFDQYKTEVDDLDLHFIHQRSENPDAIPLMLVHGWPGSISEFYKIIKPLTDPVSHGGDISDSFHIIAPSLPGFAFSEAPSTSGYSPEKIALILSQLMEKLGYQRYAIAGGDWGAIINRHLANHFPERLIGLHSNMILASPPSNAER